MMATLHFTSHASTGRRKCTISLLELEPTTICWTTLVNRFSVHCNCIYVLITFSNLEFLQENETPFHVACRYGQVELCETILRKGKHCAITDVHSIGGYFMFMVQRGNQKTIIIDHSWSGRPSYLPLWNHLQSTKRRPVIKRWPVPCWSLSLNLLKRANLFQRVQKQ